MSREIKSTNNKALELNLDPSSYGTIAEIGGGQEVSRKFFQAGGASGTIAKTISAYDKSFSDYIYNKGVPDRYVSENRLDKMLHREYTDLINILGSQMSSETRFFAFANTVTTLNYKKDNFSHGWMGMRFQLHAGSEPNYAVLHVTLLENDALMQQNTLGVLGVNLIHACYYCCPDPNDFIQSLMDNLSHDQLEITMLRLAGPDFVDVDNRILGVQLVKNGMTKAIMFDRYGNVQEPVDLLYKKNVLAFRGSFRPATYVTVDMLKTSYSIFKTDEDYDKNNTISLCEMTLHNLLDDGELDERDFLDRVDILNRLGQSVMVSNFSEYYKLVDYFSQFKIIKVRIVMGILTFIKVLDEKYYSNLKGGILEAFGKLFPDNMKLYVYPALNDDKSDLLMCKDLELNENTRLLLDYLQTKRKILEIENVRPDRLHIFPKDVMQMIQQQNKAWEFMVPKTVVKIIKKKRLFGYKE
ncbi:MAG: hypothetical protein JEZ03_04390 [Bacteroidales bacterium]|nr:hypothetical protein [Bacteroidales bacterium]